MSNPARIPPTATPLFDPDDWRRARLANLILGAWLFASAFIWPHTSASRMNTWIVGLAIAVIAAVALRVARILNSVLSMWLIMSSFWL